jgi:hypothetical protein
MASEMDFDNVLVFLIHLFTDHIIPAVLFAAAFVALYLIGLTVSRVIWPPSAQEIHDEAVKLLKRDVGRRTEVHKLLRAAMDKDPELEVAYITLASDLLYGGGGKDIDQALDVLRDAKQRFPESDEVDILSAEGLFLKKFGKASGAEAASAKMRKMVEAGQFPLR